MNGYEKLEQIKASIKELKKVTVAFSAGVDSTFLLRVAHDVLGDNVLAVTFRSDVLPAEELDDSIAFCRKENVRQIILDADVLHIDGFADNPPDRCYLCKRALFSKMTRLAEQEGYPAVLEGSNADDQNDYRPGYRAVRELGVRSPLLEAGLTKAEIRLLSKNMGLPTWDKPSFACLASRFVYGETITKEKLDRVEKAERYLKKMGLSQVRVRVHGDLARIEVLPSDFIRLTVFGRADRIDKNLKHLGFAYVALDLGGYRTGSMNRSIEQKEK